MPGPPTRALGGSRGAVLLPLGNFEILGFCDWILGYNLILGLLGLFLCHFGDNVDLLQTHSVLLRLVPAEFQRFCLV